MSAPTPQEIRDRLAKIEITLQETFVKLTAGGQVEILPLDALLVVSIKAAVLQATALTLLAEQQDLANMIATAQVWATMGEYRNAREILSDPRLRGTNG